MTTTPNLGLTKPTVGGDPDVWGEELNDNLDLIDDDDHSTHPIGVSGIAIDGDLDLDGNNITTIKANRYDDQSSTLGAASDVLELYSLDGELTWKTSAGVDVQLTNGTGVNAAGITTNTYETQTVAGALVIGASDTFDLLLVSTAAARAITLPLANAVADGRRFKIKDITGTAQTNNITLIRSGSDSIEGVAGNKTLATNYGGWEIVSDGSTNWWLI